MTSEEKKRLEEYKSQGTLSQEQAKDYFSLLMKESEQDAGASEVGVEEVTVAYAKPKRGRPAKK